MTWREYFADVLPDYFIMFVALLAGNMSLYMFTSAEKFSGIWIVLLLLMTCVALGKLDELLPATKNAWKVKLCTLTAYAILIVLLWRILSSFPLSRDGMIIVQLIALVGTAFITIVSSIFVFDEENKIHKIKKAPS